MMGNRIILKPFMEWDIGGLMRNGDEKENPDECV